MPSGRAELGIPDALEYQRSEQLVQQGTLLGHGPVVQREIDATVGARHGSPVSPAIGTQVAQQVGAEPIGILSESRFGNEGQCPALGRCRNSDESRPGKGVAPVVPRRGRPAQVLRRDEHGVPAVIQQVGERGPQPGIALTRRHHAGRKGIEETIDQGDPLPGPLQRIVCLVVA
jgi:hypothetical protein